jgi:hypothetical protein
MVRIPPGFLRQLLLRGLAVWMLARLVALLVVEVMRAMAGDKAMLEGVAAHPGSMVVVAAALMLVDLHRRKELMLLNNLGVATSHAVFVGSIPALLFEAVRLVMVT